MKKYEYKVDVIQLGGDTSLFADLEESLNHPRRKGWEEWEPISSFGHVVNGTTKGVATIWRRETSD